MKLITYAILTVILSLSCKKVSRKHDINTKWKVVYYTENGQSVNIPISGGEYFISFNKKRFTCIAPINDIGGKCEIYKNGDLAFTSIIRTLVYGDSTKVYWEDYFINQLSNSISYEIIEKDTLKLAQKNGAIVLSK